jgi:hypothetical protein
MKSFYVAACCLLLAAIAADFCSKSFYHNAASAVARAIVNERTNQSSAKEESTASLQNGNRCVVVGLVLALMGLLSWLWAIRKGNRLSPVIPLALMFAYVVMSLMLV